MQMTGAPNQLPANKSPPMPMVQTSVGNATSISSNSPTESTQELVQQSQQHQQNNADGHSRTISQSSATSSVPELVAVNTVINSN